MMGSPGMTMLGRFMGAMTVNALVGRLDGNQMGVRRRSHRECSRQYGKD
jgi:hypothetical protein